VHLHSCASQAALMIALVQRGVTHAFVMEFENEEDREYYLEKDPQHLLFVKSLEGKVAIVQVVDFEPGKF